MKKLLVLLLPFLLVSCSEATSSGPDAGSEGDALSNTQSGVNGECREALEEVDREKREKVSYYHTRETPCLDCYLFDRSTCEKCSASHCENLREYHELSIEYGESLRSANEECGITEERDKEIAREVWDRKELRDRSDCRF